MQFLKYLMLIIGIFCNNNLCAQNQCLDQSFGNAGISSHNFGTDSIFPKSIGIQTDGKIVIAGSINDGSGSDFLLLRYLSNGNIDSSFGTLGIVRTDFAIGTTDKAVRLIIQTDGKLLVGGNTQNNGIKQLALIRYNSDGLIDNSFGTNGKMSLGSNLTFEDMEIFPNGNIILCGNTFNTTIWPNLTTNWFYRITSNGSIDNTFGTNGFITFTNNSPNFGTVERVKKLKIQPDQKILALSIETNEGSEQKFIVLRFNTDGSLDNTFNNVGYAKTEGQHMIYSRDLLLQNDGKIIIQGSAGNNGDLGFYLSRLNNDGSIDSAFGINGIKFNNPIIGNNQQNCKSIYYPDGKIYSVGDNYEFWSSAVPSFALFITDANGMQDTLSCNNGYLITDIDDDNSVDAALQMDGKIIQLGTTNFNNLIMIRYLGNQITSISVKDESRSIKAKIYPNPVSNKIFIENGIGLMQIYDLSGRLLFAKQIKAMVEQIEIGEIKSGCYIMKIENENDISSLRFIKE